LLGCYYAQSPIIYFSPNPGSWGCEMDFVPAFDGRSGPNPLFDSSDEYVRGRQGGYGRKWRQFLADNPGLYHWFNDRVTSTFLCPWRTPDGRDLDNLDRDTDHRLFDYSGQLVRKIIEHHTPRLLIMAGIKSLHCLNETLRVWNLAEINRAVVGPEPQCRKLVIDRMDITVLQIPHFSYRFLSSLHFEILAGWLRMELREIGLKN